MRRTVLMLVAVMVLPACSGNSAALSAGAGSRPPGWPNLASPAVQNSESSFEIPPVLSAQTLVPAAELSGPGFQVDNRVPTDGLMAHFTIRSDFGTLQPVGRQVLVTWVGQMPALASLENMSKTAEFVKAVGNAAARPVEAAAEMITSPVQTVEGLPSAMGRLFERVELGAESIAQAEQAPNEDLSERAQLVARRVGAFTIDMLGYGQVRQRLAKQIGVDPYTTNPILSEKLTNIAWVAFSGRVGLETLISVMVPDSIFISGTTVTRDFVYDTPPGDLINRNKQKLLDMGAAQSSVWKLFQNQWYSLTVLTDFTNGLARIPVATGRNQAVALAATASSEEEARFFTSAVHLLAWQHERIAPLAELNGRGTVLGRTVGGALIVPAPVDYVSFTPLISRFAHRPDLRNPDRSLLLTGKLSPRAREELTALGWKIREEVVPWQ
jgi:hypothetical protein